MVFKILSLVMGLFYLYLICIRLIKTVAEEYDAVAILIFVGLAWLCVNSILSDIAYLENIMPY